MARVRTANEPEKGAPSVDWSAFSFTGDGTAFNRSFRYVHRIHDLQDILRPGYFNAIPEGSLTDKSVTIQMWDEISFCVDGPDPCDATRGLLVIEKMPSRGNEDVIVGLVNRYKTTPSRKKADETEQAA